MTNFTAARRNMVEGQIRPNGVIDGGVLQAFSDIPRESFVAGPHRAAAYCDEDVVFDAHGFLIEPSVQARMIEALALNADDLVLHIACDGGYGAAILSSLVSTVVNIETDKSKLDPMNALWGDLGIGNIVGAHTQSLPSGCTEHAPYDAVLVSGSVAGAPETLLEQLKPGGYLVAIIRAGKGLTGQVTLFQKQDTGHSSRVLFEAGCPYLPGFEPEPAFTF